MSEELKPCPFCGEPATPGFCAQNNFVRCTGCSCRTWSCYDTAAKAIAAWNTRKHAPNVARCIEHLRRAIGDLNTYIDRSDLRLDTEQMNALHNIHTVVYNAMSALGINCDADFFCADFTKRGE